jgi:hypothetical protein
VACIEARRNRAQGLARQRQIENQPHDRGGFRVGHESRLSALRLVGVEPSVAVRRLPARDGFATGDAGAPSALRAATDVFPLALGQDGVDGLF